MLIRYRFSFIIKLQGLPKRTSRDSEKLTVRQQALASLAVPSLKLLDELKEAKNVLDSFQISGEISIVAAHWAPKKTLKFIAELESKGVEVVIAAADGSAHLPGMIASLTTIPVIGVPLRGSSLDGLDSLLSIVQMPSGVPVGTMGINSAYNAAMLCLSNIESKVPLS
jgi:5-(carboxyamino)imidazole ribonucleotide mutase